MENSRHYTSNKPETIDPDVLKDYNLTVNDLDKLYENYKLYNAIRVKNKKLKLKKQNEQTNTPERYTCSVCDKSVRYANQWYHERTKKHKLRLEITS